MQLRGPHHNESVTRSTSTMKAKSTLKFVCDSYPIKFFKYWNCASYYVMPRHACVVPSEANSILVPPIRREASIGEPMAFASSVPIGRYWRRPITKKPKKKHPHHHTIISFIKIIHESSSTDTCWLSYSLFCWNLLRTSSIKTSSHHQKKILRVCPSRFKT